MDRATRPLIERAARAASNGYRVSRHEPPRPPPAAPMARMPSAPCQPTSQRGKGSRLLGAASMYCYRAVLSCEWRTVTWLRPGPPNHVQARSALQPGTSGTHIGKPAERQSLCLFLARPRVPALCVFKPIRRIVCCQKRRRKERMSWCEGPSISLVSGLYLPTWVPGRQFRLL